VFRDINVASELPIWLEPITRTAEHMFGGFDPAANDDILVPLGAIDGVMEGRTKYDCD
jgi:hypothetical protein